VRRLLTPDQLGTRMLAACGVVLILVVGGAMLVESWQRRVSELIDRDWPGQGQLTAVVDVTDRMTVQQAARLENQLRQLVETELQPGDVVTVWALGQFSEGPLQRVVRLHVPPHRNNPLYQNPREVLDRYEVRFAHPLRAFLATLPAVSTARWSPIVEAVGTLAELPELHGAGARRLLLVSDLEQHSRFISFLSHQPTFSAFRRTRAGSELPDLHSVVVQVLVIPRSGQDLRLELGRERFWTEYFRAAGAASVVVGRL
jgi:hypothetical protein